MKVIDLLNKIANEEIDRNNKYQFSRDDYCTINDFFARYIVDEENLNLEIIEENNKIEKLDVILDEHFTNDELQAYIYETQIKLNELIDVINEMKKGE